jgi:hypothetical protein
MLAPWRDIYENQGVHHPESGFIASTEVRMTGDTPPERTYASQTYFADYEEEKVRRFGESAEMELDETLGLVTYRRYSRYGWMALVMMGTDKASEFVVLVDGERQSILGWVVYLLEGLMDITGTKIGYWSALRWNLITRDLGHHFLTDVLEISIQGIPQSVQKDSAYLSFLYALLEGSCQSQGIRRDDIDGTLYYRIFGDSPSFILYDSVPGGAGHVLNIKEHLRDAAEAALKKMETCNCGEDTSCYNCLRNYRNQRFHDELQRGYAIKILRKLLGYD